MDYDESFELDAVADTISALWVIAFESRTAPYSVEVSIADMP